MQANIRNELEAAKIGPLQIAVVAFVGTVMIFDGLDIQLSALVAPVIMAEWALSKTDFASVLAAALIGMTVGTPIGGWLGDRLGRRWTLIASVAFFGAATMACSAADSLRMLVALRFIGGLGFGAAMVIDTQEHLFITQGYLAAGNPQMVAGSDWYRYDIANGSWHTLSPLPAALGYVVLTASSDGNILLQGGATDAGQNHQSNSIYRPSPRALSIARGCRTTGSAFAFIERPSQLS